MRLGRGQEVRLDWRRLSTPTRPSHDAWYGYAELCLFLGHARRVSPRPPRLARSLRGRASTRTSPNESAGPACSCRPRRTSCGKRPPSSISPWPPSSRHPAGFTPTSCSPRAWPSIARAGWTSAISLMEGEAAPVHGTCPPPGRGHGPTPSGTKEEARKTLAAAILAFDWRADHADIRDAWICHMLRREAEAMILPNLPAFSRESTSRGQRRADRATSSTVSSGSQLVLQRRQDVTRTILIKSRLFVAS